MTTIESRLTPPRPVEVVSAEEAGTIIDGAHRELAELEARAARARALADETSARLEREGADEQASAWAIVRLQRFLDQLRDEAEHDARVVVAAAHRSASTELDPIVDEQPMPAAPTLVASPEPVVLAAPEPTAPSVSEATAIAAEVPLAVVPDVPTPPPTDDTSAARASEPEPEPPPLQVVSWVPPSSDLSGPQAPTNGDGAHAASVAFDDHVTVAAPAAPVAEPAPASAVAPAPVASAPTAPRTKHRKFLRGFPLSAALEVIAVLLVLAFILLRLS